ncbi:hypothetical protein E6C76_03370 [Pseudothauera nasutitermitis]|uniref:Uncharacterized protein n=1 Tax=Pseudothauera nasutitermitis TaxID=2565930 RepID=A0A4S4B3Z8_9RHOO|nr:hypothetical protein [Pseudothauera nasutitermitis]THF67418.1 hypothetical protein E6C76_03370 [Pseudothauera nasutitermitis]
MIARLSIAVGLLLGATVALASFPFAAGDISRSECIDALKLAKEMFQSTAQRLYAPLTIPTGLRSTLVLGASELDISGGSALTSTDDFEMLSQDIRNIYWGKETDGALRVVVREISVGWRGNRYDLYLLDAAVEKNDFLNGINPAAGSDHYRPVVSGTWRPPLVFQHPQNKEKWFIDVGQPFQILADWRVYSSKEMRAICTIVFSPLGNDAAGILPRPVRRLARKLDEALGPGNDEGTLQPTARTRLDTKHVLANAALRPWALVDGDAYNSRSEVDAGLEDWARVNNSRRRLYEEILKEYPVAERSLAAYYVNTYGLQPQEAQEAAAWILDLIFRSFFVFSNGQNYFRYDGVRTNPWPLKH